MIALIDKVQINRRFARSARLDADLEGTPPLVGYVLQASIAKALSTMAASQAESRQGAFTWTGPYGGGKSSAALLIANLIGGSKRNRALAAEIAGEELTKKFATAFPAPRGSWTVVAVTGSRTPLRETILQSAAGPLNWSAKDRASLAQSDERLVERLLADSESRRGVLLILDELGKMLEHEAIDGGDIHLLQDLAERASRSGGRLVVVGILHQSFDQYAARAARNARKEWAKVQGRFHDIAFLSGADETVALLGQAITCEKRPASSAAAAKGVAEAVAKRRPAEVESLSRALSATWPLNPVTALLLGPVSRQRFAQNERSVFGFLSSAEPHGFQDFLGGAIGNETYDPPRLWDYLGANFGMALASGPEGHRFSLAFEAIERAGAKGGALHVELTKAAAVIELFRNGSGVTVADDFLVASLPKAGADEVGKAINDLLEWAILIRQPRLGGYALFAGSDFDLEEAVARASGAVNRETLAEIPERIGIGSAAAKRHYFDRGSLRTFDIHLELISEDDEDQAISQRVSGRPAKGSGILVLLLSDGSLKVPALDKKAKALARSLHDRGVVAAVAAAQSGEDLRLTVSELVAVERVFRDHPQLEGDRIAKREIAARQGRAIDELHRQVDQSLEGAKWWLAAEPLKSEVGPLSVVASALADTAFSETPIIASELLQRDRPSSSAMAALRDLCRAMVLRPQEEALGITGYPAHKGLYLTILQPLGLHRKEGGVTDFYAPGDTEAGKSLLPAWKFVEESNDILLSDLFDRWAAPPYGIKRGVMPVLALAYMMANRDRLAVYLDDVFQTAFDDVFADKLLQKGTIVRLRHIDRSVREAAFLTGLAQSLGVEEEGSALDVAKALFQRFDALPDFARRSALVSSNTQLVRSVVLKSRDPEALLFEHLPDALGEELSSEIVRSSLAECESLYPALCDEIRGALARVLGTDPQHFTGLTERAQAVKGLTNDLTFDAFAMRAAGFEGETPDVEGLASLLVHKPPMNWSDRDREQAFTQLANFGRRFRELEAVAVVRERKSSTEAVALVIGVDPSIPPLLRSFELTEAEKLEATRLAEQVLSGLRSAGGTEELQFAALARAVAALSGEAAPVAEAEAA
jgi:hypothetical protein